MKRKVKNIVIGGVIGLFVFVGVSYGTTVSAYTNIDSRNTFNNLNSQIGEVSSKKSIVLNSEKNNQSQDNFNLVGTYSWNLNENSEISKYDLVPLFSPNNKTGEVPLFKNDQMHFDEEHVVFELSDVSSFDVSYFPNSLRALNMALMDAPSNQLAVSDCINRNLVNKDLTMSLSNRANSVGTDNSLSYVSHYKA
jgi:hypothetical protein